MPDDQTTQRPQGFATRLSHAGRAGTHVRGFVNPPVHRGSTMLHVDIADRVAGGKQRLDQAATYGVHGNTTHHMLENVVAEIEGGTRCQIVSSGLAAVTTPLLTYLGAGDHCLMPDSVYGPARNFANGMMVRLGIETTFYDPEIAPEALAPLFRENTRVLYLESPGSHTFEVQDVPALSTLAHSKGAKVLLDNTWGIHFFQPFQHGVDVSIQALTKYVVGHSDVLLGSITVADPAEWARVREGALALGQYASRTIAGWRCGACERWGCGWSGRCGRGSRWRRGSPGGRRCRRCCIPDCRGRRGMRCGSAIYRGVQPVRGGVPAGDHGGGDASDDRFAELVRDRGELGRVREPGLADDGVPAAERGLGAFHRAGLPVPYRARGAGRPDRRPGAGHADVARVRVGVEAAATPYSVDGRG